VTPPLRSRSIAKSRVRWTMSCRWRLVAGANGYTTRRLLIDHALPLIASDEGRWVRVWSVLIVVRLCDYPCDRVSVWSLEGKSNRQAGSHHTQSRLSKGVQTLAEEKVSTSSFNSTFLPPSIFDRPCSDQFVSATASQRCSAVRHCPDCQEKKPTRDPEYLGQSWRSRVPYSRVHPVEE